MRCLCILWVTVSINLCAQQAPVLTNTGTPMTVSFACAEDELEAAGMDCPADHPCPVYLELSAVAGAGQRIVTSGNLHSASGTMGSILLTSADDGVTWKEPAARIRGAALDQIQFFDAAHAWAGGETQYPLARDPFFLITDDGGNLWHEQDVSDEGGPGSVLSFWFDSVRHGELIVDAGASAGRNRYALWESENGGDGWSIKSASEKPAKLGGSAAENPDWRARSGQDGAVWQIEKRSGERWAPVAAFSVEVARCVIKPGEVKPPEPDDAQTPPQR